MIPFNVKKHSDITITVSGDSSVPGDEKTFYLHKVREAGWRLLRGRRRGRRGSPPPPPPLLLPRERRLRARGAHGGWWGARARRCCRVACAAPRAAQARARRLPRCARHCTARPRPRSQFPLISKSQYFDENIPESAASGLTEMVIKVRRGEGRAPPPAAAAAARASTRLRYRPPLAPCRTFRARFRRLRSWPSTATALTLS
jgi:hypothetical protein